MAKGSGAGFDAEGFLAGLKARLAEPLGGKDDFSILDLAEKIGPWLMTATAEDIRAAIAVLDEGVTEVQRSGSEDAVPLCVGIVMLKAVLAGQLAHLTRPRKG